MTKNGDDSLGRALTCLGLAVGVAIMTLISACEEQRDAKLPSADSSAAPARSVARAPVSGPEAGSALSPHDLERQLDALEREIDAPRGADVKRR